MYKMSRLLDEIYFIGKVFPFDGMKVSNVKKVLMDIRDKPFFISFLRLGCQKRQLISLSVCLWCFVCAYTISILSGSDTYHCLHINDENSNEMEMMMRQWRQTGVQERKKLYKNDKNVHLYALHPLSFLFIQSFCISSIDWHCIRIS